MKILVPVDGSEHSMEGANVALEYAKMKGAEVCLLSVVPSIADITHGLTLSQGEAVKSSMVEQAERFVEKAKEVFLAGGITPRAIVKDATNTVADEICDVVEDESIDLVVIGSHGLGGIGRFLMGSVASKVVRHCPCSVFVVRES